MNTSKRLYHIQINVVNDGMANNQILYSFIDKIEEKIIKKIIHKLLKTLTFFPKAGGVNSYLNKILPTILGLDEGAMIYDYENASEVQKTQCITAFNDNTLMIIISATPEAVTIQTRYAKSRGNSGKLLKTFEVTH